MSQTNYTRSRRKVVIVGDTGSGKTTLYETFRLILEGLPYRSLEPHYTPRYFSYVAKYVVDDRNLELAMWDTSESREGENDDHNRLRPTSYWTAQAFVIAFAADDPRSLQNVYRKWMPELERFNTGLKQPTPPVLIVACKMDLIPPSFASHSQLISQTPVSDRAEAIARAISAWGYCECSSNDGTGIVEVFDAIGRACLSTDSKYDIPRKSSWSSWVS